MRGQHPYRFPGKPKCTFSSARGDNEVECWEFYGDYYGDVKTVWSVAEWRKAHRFAPQDLVVKVPPSQIRWYQYPDGRIVGRRE